MSNCCTAALSSAYGTKPFSIVRRVRQGTPRFEAEWLPTRCRRVFATKAEATAWVKAHERRAYGR